MYKIHNEQGAVQRSGGGVIPVDERNRDYRKYLAWVAKGNKPDPMDEPTVIPDPRIIVGGMISGATRDALDKASTVAELRTVLARILIGD